MVFSSLMCAVILFGCVGCAESQAASSNNAKKETKIVFRDNEVPSFRIVKRQQQLRVVVDKPGSKGKTRVGSNPLVD